MRSCAPSFLRRQAAAVLANSAGDPVLDLLQGSQAIQRALPIVRYRPMMPYLSKHTGCTLAALFIGCLTTRAAEPANPIALTVDESKGEAEVTFRGKRVLLYTFARTQHKPYVRELCMPGGGNVLRDAPADHLHHHGLMYAIRINGVNFWEERGAPGHERHVRWLHKETGTDASGHPVATLVELIHWIPDKDKALEDAAKAALMVETRTLRVSMDEQAHEVALDWEGAFAVGPAASEVRLHGSEYNGLGMRLAQPWDHVAVHANSTRKAFPNGGRRDVLPARWTSTTLAGVGMLAFFGHADNARGDTRFFTTLDPYTYLSATQALNGEPILHRSGDEWRVRYLLTVGSEKQTPDSLDARWEQWNQATAKKSDKETAPPKP